MATEKALMKVKWFVLYGSETPLCRPDSIMNKIQRLLKKSDCPALVDLIQIGQGEKAMNKVKEVISVSARALRRGDKPFCILDVLARSFFSSFPSSTSFATCSVGHTRFFNLEDVSPPPKSHH